MFVFDPATSKIRDLGDLTEACGEKGRKAIVQGKSHVGFVESAGKLYFATHVGYYSIIDGMEKMGVPPAGYEPYPGGHLLAYDMKTGKFDNLAIAPHREGILSMNMDTARGRIFGLTWPTGRFFRFDLARASSRISDRSASRARTARAPTIARFAARSASTLATARPTSQTVMGRFTVTAEQQTQSRWSGVTTSRKTTSAFTIPPLPATWAITGARSSGYRRRSKFYGVHGNSGYLFRFDPRAERIEVLDRITSLPSQRSGMFDQFSYGYLGFTLGPDGRTLYYLTGGPVYVDGKRVAGKSKTAMGESKGIENLHLITYDVPTGRYADHGAIFFADGQRPSYVNSIAVGKDGTVYALSRITQDGKTRTDLMSIPASLIRDPVNRPRPAAD